MKTHPEPPKIADKIRAISASLAASGFVAVTQLITRSDFTYCLRAALICFAVSIPMLAGFAVQPPTVFPRGGHFTLLAVIRLSAFVLAMAISVLGLAFCFFHFSMLIGSLFSCSAIAAFSFVPRRMSEYEKPQPEAK